MRPPPDYRAAPLGVRWHFLDSGAFTMQTWAKEWQARTGAPDRWGYYDTAEHWRYVDDYCRFVIKNMDGIDYFAGVDAIGHPGLSYRNQKYVERRWKIEPVPVIHTNTDISWVRKYVEEGYTFIGLGSAVDKVGSSGMRDWMDKVFAYVCDTPDRTPRVRVHGFGVTRFSLFTRYPWYCMTEENHEVLTKNGWRGLSDLTPGMEILCYDKGESMWQEIEEVPTYEVKNVDLIRLHNRKINALDATVTWNHRWAVVDRDRPTHMGFRETWQLKQTDTIPRVGTYRDFPKEKKYKSCLVRLGAWYWTEGNIKNCKRYKTPSVTISQSFTANPKKAARIRRDLVRSGEKFCESTAYRKNGSVEVTFVLYGHVRDWLMETFPDKTIQNEFILNLTEKQLNQFIDVSVMADGHRRRMVNCGQNRWEASLSQKDWKNTEQYRFACILAGHATSIHVGVKGNPVVRICRGPQTKRAWVKSLERETVRYTGRLWCVRVPSGAFFVRSRGCVFVTGNSVDSASWTKVGAYGGILVPHYRGGRFVFTQNPYVMKVADESPDRGKAGGHYACLPPTQKKLIRMWLDYCGLPLGDENNPGVVNNHCIRKDACVQFFEGLAAAVSAYPWAWRPRLLKGLDI